VAQSSHRCPVPQARRPNVLISRAACSLQPATLIDPDYLIRVEGGWFTKQVEMEVTGYVIDLCTRIP
jgi:hypothetical protein